MTKVSSIAMAAVVIFVGGCNRGGPSGTGKRGTVNFLIESAPTNLDPRIGTDAQSQRIDALIFSSLLAHDARMNIAPDLAESWDIPNPLTYVFHLRRGVKFHDGRALTSADVKYTFDTILSGAVKTAKRGAFRTVSSIDAPDDYTIVFHLTEPYASFLWNLTRPAVGIVPRGSGAEMSTHPIGSGPFRFVSMTPDEEIVLERNQDYFGSAGAKPGMTPSHDTSSPLDEGTRTGAISTTTAGAYGALPPLVLDERLREEAAIPIERVRLRIVPDAIVRALELRKGTADGEINTLTPDMYAALARQTGIEVDEQPGTTMAYIAFNFDDPILSHREVRQALAYAVDRASLIKYLLKGQARPASSLLPPNHWAYEANVRQYDYDPSRAEHLLDAAGFHRGADGVRFHLALKTSTDASTRLMTEAIADQWKRVGVALELRSMELATFYSDITHGSFQAYTLRWVGGNNDPDIFQYVFSSKKMPPDGANRGHYRNPQLDALLDREHVEMDREKRKAILSQIQKIVADDEPYIDLWYPDNVAAHRARLTNIVIPPAGDYEFLDDARLK
ncbi:MAG: ABC transporter substrate-binding protein [Candidatus Acidiferrales bacterium]